MIITDWFVGIVEDVNDPNGQGRVRVRCLGYHTPDRNQLPTIDLPLATVISPTTSAATAGIGFSSTALQPNTWVFGFFRDGAELQDPAILGTIASASGYDAGFDTTSNMGFGDPHGAFKSFVGNDMPPEAGTFSAANSSGVLNGYGAGNTSSNIAYNSNGLTSSFDTPGAIPPTLSGNTADKIISVAKSQIGITETSNNQGAGIEKFWTATDYSGGYAQRKPWCAAFVCWVIQQSGILSETERPKTASVTGVENWALSKSYAQTRFNPRFVKRGDICTLKSDSHVIIAITDSDPSGNFTAIDGNSGSRVINERRKTLSNTKCAITLTNSASSVAVV